MSVLAEILSSKVRAELFRILWASTPIECHLRDLERKAGMAVGSIQQEVKKLLGLGLLEKRVDGNRAYFRANTAHPLYRDIQQLMLKTVGIVDVFKEALVSEKIRLAFVFGSIAEGNAKAHSDIDLFIIGDIGLRELSKLLKSPAHTLGREVNPHILTLPEWKRRLAQKEHFVNTVAQGKKMMVIGDWHELECLGE